MASSSSSSAEAAAPRRLEYVGFWKRVVAFAIDTLILLIVIVPLLFAVYGTEYLQRAQEFGVAGFWDFAIQVVMPAVAVILFWKYRGATPGKMAISARIVNATTGAAPSTGQLVGRYFAYIVSALPFGLGFIWIAIDRRKQGFHDKLAGTAVIYDDD
ncbi:MAG: RDD family protein [Betaproteobacteria bacterium]|nr:MAG: RDD family protein [Betaproteobacteria bacterium]